jgi:hypothetical protein
MRCLERMVENLDPSGTGRLIACTMLIFVVAVFLGTLNYPFGCLDAHGTAVARNSFGRLHARCFWWSMLCDFDVVWQPAKSDEEGHDAKTSVGASLFFDNPSKA